jgi:dihydroneopterin aldolase
MEAIKEFFTNSEWDLIHSLVSNNREFCEDDEFDPVSDYDSVIDKIYNLFKTDEVTL